MNDGAQSNSLGPARVFEVTDAQLAADLKKTVGKGPANYPAGELLDRHWEAAFTYSRLCTNGVRPAGMLTTAAFTRLFGESLRATGPTAAWRPLLLVTVRRMAAEWDMDQRRTLLSPELQAGSSAVDRTAVRFLPPVNRRLLSRAFQRLSEPSRCLLWHMTVEAEELAVPAGLVGLSPEDASDELQRAVARLREGCLEIHRELAPAEDCRHYNRLLDVSCRRGAVNLDRDLRRHLAGCGHCRHAADQLNQFHGSLALPLAEAVIGWGAQAYVDTRPGGAIAIVEVPRTPTDESAREEDIRFPARAPHAKSRSSRPPERPRDRRSDPAQQRPANAASTAPTHRIRRSPRRRNIALAVLTLSGLILVPLVLWAGSASHDMAEGDDPSSAPGSSKDTAPGGSKSWIGTGAAADGVVLGRLRNDETGQCIGIPGKDAVKGAEAELTSCSSAESRDWSYEADGLLRDLAAPDLCLDSHLGFELRLAPCEGKSQPNINNVRYDFTVQGTLVPRWNQDLALASGSDKSTAPLVLKLRKDEPAQHWTFDTSSPSLQMEAVNWQGDPQPPALNPAPQSAKTPKPIPDPTDKSSAPPSSTPKPKPTPTPSVTTPAWGICYPYSYCPGTGQYELPDSGSDYGHDGGGHDGGGGHHGGGGH